MFCEVGGGLGRGVNRIGCFRRFFEGSSFEEGWYLEFYRDRERRVYCVLGFLGIVGFFWCCLRGFDFIT